MKSFAGKAFLVGALLGGASNNARNQREAAQRQAALQQENNRLLRALAIKQGAYIEPPPRQIAGAGEILFIGACLLALWWLGVL